MADSWTVLRILKWTADYFREKGIEGGRLDAELLLADALGLDRVGLYLNFDRPLTPEEQGAFRERVRRRALREPVQYILGRTEFWSLTLKVGPQVLIPRADTEILVEEGIRKAPETGSILDVGTGSGAVAVALAHELPGCRVEGTDISDEALQVAAGNAALNGVAEKVRFRKADLYRLEGGGYDLIVSNPPYIPKGDLAALMPEVRDFEPHLALDGGSDGLDCYRSLVAQAPSLLHPGGWLLVEAGEGQAECVRKLFGEAGLTDIYSRDDYAGIPRVVGGKKPKAVKGEK